eukprot:CAMPEP_0167790332 /NCGR_PEP_ID=MMETSP0111_2-20121227/11249_1 /TAXON_ID=91324 /ORGANISM="Lotharella globosa, Strain CCCM811" /LENGTH=54 /DNA_ID=CAMNT_0007682733 /DNA_START=14 /DNA_END=176 /DNA_ORIENTATION=+
MGPKRVRDKLQGRWRDEGQGVSGLVERTLTTATGHVLAQVHDVRLLHRDVGGGA